MTDPIEHSIVKPAAASAHDRRAHLVIYTGLGAFLLGLAALAFLWWSNHQELAQVRAESGTYQDQTRQLADQVKALGAVPVVTPAAGPAGAAGATGAPGDAGQQGQPGPPGAPGSPGPVGPPGAAGSAGADGTRGDTGQPGKDGTAGSAGQDGAAGAAGPAGPQGPTGPQGSPGPAGPPGTDGQDGQPPSGWTYTDELGIKHTCTRTTDFDPSTPTYTCSPTSTGG